ncbi:hypothetical protein G7Y31_08475 [Corynebacterium lizhenjunii]|uniref:Uncharacterized protein n=1 Tax=Corynebacterium lizhenjunii TaxID=2709394 RepID=A0A7T0KDM9_9CORY|nr:hypothetical protein [Corynebacterium lizhenjunii]QPK78584.1 hypothetical protein G7Y31_08475 [Corynebacterium lizhenjunii]
MSAQREPLPPSSSHIITDNDAASYLAALDISVEDLRDSLLDAFDAANNRDSKYWPNTSQGYEFWAQLVHGVRSRLDKSEHWEVDNPDNRPVMLREGKRYELAFARGDAATGNPDAEPNFARKAGPATISAANRFLDPDQFALISLANLITAEESSGPSSHPAGTWIVLYRYREGTINCEVSIPARIDNNGFVDSWWVRVLLPPITDFPNVDHPELPDSLNDDDLNFSII